MARYSLFPNSGTKVLPYALQAMSQANAIKLNERQMMQNLWQNMIQNKMQKEQIQAQKKAARQQAEIGWAGVGASLANTFAGPKSIGAGLVANSMAPSIGDVTSSMMLQPDSMLSGGSQFLSKIGDAAAVTSKVVDPLAKLGITYEELQNAGR